MINPKMTPRRLTRGLTAIAALTLITTTTAACGSDDNSSSGSSSSKVTLRTLDYYTDEPMNSAMTTLLKGCADPAGVTVARQTTPRDQLIPTLLRAAQSKTLPGLALVDNPDLPAVAATGGLAELDDVDTADMYPSVKAVGQYQGKTYGLAPGVNGLALFYNKKLFSAAGVQPPTTWAELRQAAKKLTKGKVFGMAFSAKANEEGSFQFEPWMWTAGGDLADLDSAPNVQALQLWSDLLSDGSVSKSVVTWGQGDVQDQFIAGNAAMMENGSWELATLAEHKIDYGVVPIPVPDAGKKPVVPMGGEVWTVPQGDPAQTAAAKKVLTCLLSSQSQLQWAKLNAYVPSSQSAAATYQQQNPAIAPFVTEVSTAKARPEGVGEKYSAISEKLWNAIQAALTGKSSPADALATASK